MAKFNFETYEQTHQTNKSDNSQSDFKVKFFKLNPGETQILRFPYKEVSELDTLDVHTIQLGDKYRKISCLRNTAYEPLEKCPLCFAGKDVKARLFAKVLYYESDPSTGTMIPKAGIWDSPISVAKQIKDFILEYGDISKMVFKVTRTGSKLETKYSIIPANQSIYKEEIYPANFSDFEGFKLENRFYLNKDYNEMETYLSTGTFPETNNTNQVNNNTSNQIFTPKISPDNYIGSNIYLNEAINNGQNAFTYNQQQPNINTMNGYVPPKTGVVEPIAHTEQQSVLQPGVQSSGNTGRRYSY